VSLRRTVLALACGVGLASSRLDAAVFQAPRSVLNVEEALRAADSTRMAGDLPAALRLAEALDDRLPRDPRVLTLLGRIKLAWPVVGRFAAESLFALAARIDSTNPEPCYLLADVGAALGHRDGDEMMHAGLLCAIERNPDYRDAWQRWEAVYHNPGRRREMANALGRYPHSFMALYRRGQLLTELGIGREGAWTLAAALEQRPADAGVMAWLARALFLNSQDDSATSVYNRAMDHADADTGDVLWKQVRGIASPEDRQRYEQAPRYARPAFYRLFWARRSGDLAAGANARISEHFQRLNYAIRYYSLLSPDSRYFRSAAYRSLLNGVGGISDLFGESGPAFAFAADTRCGESRFGATGTGGPLPPIDTTNADPLNRENDLDDRGMIYLRHGRPDTRAIGPHGTAETWCYEKLGRQVLRASFMRRTAAQAGSGDFVLTAMVHGEAETARELLTTDSPSEPVDLTFGFWLATFRGARPDTTDLVIFSDTMGALAALLDADGVERARGSGTDGSLVLSSAPGSYLLMLDGSRAGHANRFRGAARLAGYGAGLTMSSLLLANASAAPERGAMIAATARRLELSNREPTRVYAEIYGLASVDGRSRFSVTYTFERLDNRGSAQPGREVSLRFDRAGSADARTIESLVIDPGRLEAGRYRLHLEVHDSARDSSITSSRVEFRLR
jgi:tetratricopeptide (TPR) repeat protein